MTPPDVTLAGKWIAEWRGHRYYAHPAGEGAWQVYLEPLAGDGATPEFRALPDDAGGGKLLAIAELESWSESHWVLTWRGREFPATGIDNAGVSVWLRLDSTGWTEADHDWPMAHGFSESEWGLYARTIPLDEIEDLHEIRTDHLAEWRDGDRR